MANIATFLVLNLAIWMHNREWIDDTCYKLGQKGYMACPWFDIAGRVPVWHFRRVD